MRDYERHEKEIADVLAACERENRIYYERFKQIAMDTITKTRTRENEGQRTEWIWKKALAGRARRAGWESKVRMADSELIRLEKERNVPVPEDLDSLYAQYRKALSK